MYTSMARKAEPRWLNATGKRRGVLLAVLVIGVTGLLSCASSSTRQTQDSQAETQDSRTETRQRSAYRLDVTRAPFSYRISASGRKAPLLSESRPDTARSALYFVTGEGTHYLTEPVRFDTTGGQLDAVYKTTDDNRRATVDIAPAAEHEGWRVSVSFDDEGGIRRVGAGGLELATGDPDLGIGATFLPRARLRRRAAATSPAEACGRYLWAGRNHAATSHRGASRGRPSTSTGPSRTCSAQATRSPSRCRRASISGR